MKISGTKINTFLSGLSLFVVLLMGLPLNALANDEFLSEQRDSYNTLTEEDIKKERQEILSMADETLERLYKEHPKAKDEIKKAYGYGVFEAQVANAILYVA